MTSISGHLSVRPRWNTPSQPVFAHRRSFIIMTGADTRNFLGTADCCKITHGFPRRMHGFSMALESQKLIQKSPSVFISHRNTLYHNIWMDISRTSRKFYVKSLQQNRKRSRCRAHCDAGPSAFIANQNICFPTKLSDRHKLCVLTTVWHIFFDKRKPVLTHPRGCLLDRLAVIGQTDRVTTVGIY